MILSINLPYIRSSPGSFTVCRDRDSGKRVGIWARGTRSFWIPSNYIGGSIVSPSTFWLDWVQELHMSTLIETLSILRHKKKWICNECFNALPVEQRNGRGAVPYGWVPPDAKRQTCFACKREGVCDTVTRGR